MLDGFRHLSIRPEDKAAMLDGFRHLSGRSRQMRFFGSKGDVSDQELQYYTEVDNIHHMALVAIVEDDGNELIIGGGRYFSLDYYLGVLTWRSRQ